ncbi:hypothetical protein [Thalassobacillus sp. CUG 92003]|uniref:hypothetical protein n=1 Tax=Thalassobacillus sp. CUG 92003 TaxID=2736641 RepID=UPI0015E7BCE7|nr:hypothetical protein [Thalassobacillus sp. CUG 92003]
MNQLTEQEEKFLDDNFRYYTRDYDHKRSMEVVDGGELQNVEDLKPLLDRIHEFMESEFYLTTASLLAKRYGYYMVTGPMALMSGFNKFPDTTPENLTFIRIDEDKKWFPKLQLKDKQVSVPGTDRHQWVKTNMEQLMKCNVLPFFQSLNQVTRISMNVLWENFVIYLFWFYEQEADKWFEPDQLALIKDDFHFILNELPAEVFGTESHPFYYFQFQPTLRNGKRERKCCCLTYRLNEESGYCKVCPHLNQG